MIDGRWGAAEAASFITIDEAAVYARAHELRAEMDERVQEQFRHTRRARARAARRIPEDGQNAWSGKKQDRSSRTMLDS